ncbi:hypothetical protein [Kitasatospora sp. MBT66]|uniref:hypothetical protein n=1 Tax=Kitasatospora sp. MBT66 TaxID=1444769 RepID=UPI0005BA6A54|nr:hypothetical protein [Kitasatospora sp. MBT66]
MNSFISTHAVRAVAAVAALVPLLMSWYPSIPWEALVAAAAALLGAGEVAQRVENRKTLSALHETSPLDSAAWLQAELTKQEAAQIR